MVIIVPHVVHRQKELYRGGIGFHYQKKLLFALP